MFEKHFVDACLSGDAILDDIESYIEYWHTRKTGLEMHEFLGMTEYEYDQWLKNGTDIVLRDIIEAHNESIPYQEYEKMSSEKRIAARSYKEEDIEKIKHEPNDNN